MKLNELYGLRRSEEYNEFKKLIQSSLENNSAEEKEEAFRLFSQYLKNRGFSPLGAGSGGLVFRHPDLPYCIKVFSRDLIFRDSKVDLCGSTGTILLSEWNYSTE